MEPNTRVQLREARGRVHRLSLARDTARPRDGLTLWPLLTRGSVEERGRVYDRMIQIAPPPPPATRDAILRGDRAALDQW